MNCSVNGSVKHPFLSTGHLIPLPDDVIILLSTLRRKSSSPNAGAICTIPVPDVSVT